MDQPPRRLLRLRRHGLALLILAAAAGVTGAMFVPVRPLVPAGARAWTRTLVAGGLRRKELVVAPSSRRPGTPPLPLYVVLHGSDATPAFEERRTGFYALAGEGRAVLVYPAGVGQSWNAGGGCCGLAAARGINDVAFVRAVVADAIAHLGVDRHRVYLVGYSNGGKLAMRMLGADPGAFAGVAVYAATPTEPLPPGPPVPVLLAGGTSDPRTPWAGATEQGNGGPAPSVLGTAALLRRRDGLDHPGAGRRERLAGGRVTVTTWRGASRRQVLQLVAYRGRGHDWPQAEDAPLPLAALIEEFFNSLGR
jgi:polyhydroxybutyrate depolymerase